MVDQNQFLFTDLVFEQEQTVMHGYFLRQVSCISSTSKDSDTVTSIKQCWINRFYSTYQAILFLNSLLTQRRWPLRLSRQQLLQTVNWSTLLHARSGAICMDIF